MLKSTHNWTDTQIAELLRLIDKYGENPPVGTFTELAKKFGCGSRKQVSRAYKSLLNSDMSVTKIPNTSEKIYEGDAGSTRVEVVNVGTKITTLEEAIQYTKADMEVWKVKDWECTSWDTAIKLETKNGTAGIIDKTNFRLKVRFERRQPTDIVLLKKPILETVKELATATPRAPKIKKSKPSGLMLELNLPDLHYGKYVWGAECGAPYNLNITREINLWGVDALLTRVEHLGILDEIWFVVGNDILHIDNANYTTTRGTNMRAAGYWKEIFRCCWKTQIQIINKLLEKAKIVRILCVPGNHDATLGWTLGELIEAAFTNEPRVIVDNTPLPRKYCQWGKTGFMYAHADKGSMSIGTLGQVFNCEAADIYSSSDYHKVRLGHIHKHKKSGTAEIGLMLTNADCEIEYFPSLSPPDDFSSDNMHTPGVREARGLVCDKKLGPILEPVARPPRSVTHPEN